MSAEPLMEPVMTQVDPIDLLIAFEEASPMPIRPEYVEGTVIVPPRPNDNHNDGAFELSFQFRAAGIRLVGMGNGYRAAHKDGRTMALLIPDFYVRRRRPTELDESYRKAHKGWYPIDMISLVGEVTSTNHETDTGPKLRTYAAAGVPIYVLVHRRDRKAYCYSDPISPADDSTEAHYATKVEVGLGHPLTLPAPYPTLDTAPFLAD
ncbi:Uma2 family endonuclease [Streptomyces sp. PSKA54]|uniref:Uma2 family endonuclease n=1 Tax=Streptomyces himalayensis subsp. aureolus TaxID=2758039 RepID=A0A7W2CZC4_9ACTN|nr:Uma2 family endonuclease [Streptomyces himalayensis]MBA4861761.1 Uma2 family endonuclease [Streptomyces himalayensis subsp. aureolus]